MNYFYKGNNNAAWTKHLVSKLLQNRASKVYIILFRDNGAWCPSMICCVGLCLCHEILVAIESIYVRWILSPSELVTEQLTGRLLYWKVHQIQEVFMLYLHWSFWLLWMIIRSIRMTSYKCYFELKTKIILHPWHYKFHINRKPNR